MGVFCDGRRGFGMAESKDRWVSCARVDDIPEGKIIAVNVEGHPVALARSEGVVRAVDNRCPHMGYPLSEGTLHNGILICDWHHARFDLASGCTFDPWADDVQSYPVEVREGSVFVNVGANGRDAVSHWKRRLREGLEQNIGLIVAKSVIALEAAHAPTREITETGALYGARFRRAGWGPGMTILTAMANALPKLSESDRILALYQGLIHVSGETSASAPRIVYTALESDEHTLARLKEWFRYFIEVRNSEGAERALLTAIEKGATPAEVGDMMVAAATDHFYRNGGHTLDFINKGFELLDHIGWENAREILPTLVGMLAGSSRSEEQNRWRSPHDLVTLLKDTFEELETLVAVGRGKKWASSASDSLVKTLLGDDPVAIVNSLKEALKDGALLVELTRTLAYAAAVRIARFHTKNEIGDWIAVLHTYTYANALHQCAKRSPSVELLRGVFHGAMAVYFDRWFNKPSARLPQNRRETQTLPTDSDELLAGFLELLDTQGQTDLAGMYAYRYLSLGHPRSRLLEALGHALLREDADFHDFQMLEAAFQQIEELDEERATMTLVAAARYQAAHSPTARARHQTATLALRLHRGENLSAEDPDEEVA
jgi:nitrite reductase/ring-hydroxylating ferredoxin subunit